MNSAAYEDQDDIEADPEGVEAGVYAASHARVSRRFAFRLAVVLGVIMMALGVWVAHILTLQDEAEARRLAVERAEGVLSGRAARVAEWLQSRQDSLQAMIRDDSLRILATEMAAARAEGRETAVSSELVFLRITLERQARAAAAEGAMLAYMDGAPWLQVNADQPVTPDLDPNALDALATRAEPMILTAASGEVSVLTFLETVPAFGDITRPIAILGARFRATDLILESRIPPELAIPGETVSLHPAMAAPDGTATEPAGPHPQDAALVVTRQLDSLPGWRLDYHRPMDQVLAGTEARFIGRVGFAIVATIAVIGIVLGLSWRQGAITQRSMAAQARRFADRIAQEHQLLNTIINGISEYLFVVDGRGRVQFANAAACSLSGYTLEENIGRPLADALDSAATAQTLLTSAPDGEMSQPIDCDLAGESRWVMCLQNEIESGADGRPEDARWVLLIHDITELIEERIRSETLQQSIVRVLGRTVGAADPYLADQSERVERFAMTMADALGISGDERLTIAMAAKVSQIGKLFVPRDLLNKTERLTPEEREVLKAHADYAADLIEDLGTDLPIAQTVMEITERLDGSGYPNGLSGDQISRAGRLLAVADVMAARTAERSYRKAAQAADVLEILRNHPDRFDSTMVEAAGAALDLAESR